MRNRRLVVGVAIGLVVGLIVLLSLGFGAAGTGPGAG